MKKKYIILLIISVVFISCNRKEQADEKKLYEYLINKTFIRLDTVNGKELIYKSCYANIPSFKFLNKTILWDVGQETSLLYIKKITLEHDLLRLNVSYSENREASESLLFKLDTLNSKLLFEEYNYTDKTFSKQYPYIEQSCEECFDIEYCKGLEKIKKIKGLYKGKLLTTWVQNNQEFGEVNIMIDENIELNIITPDSIIYSSKTNKAQNVSYPNNIKIIGSLIGLENNILKVYVNDVFFDSKYQEEKSIEEFGITFKDGLIYLNGDILSIEKGGFNEIASPVLHLEE